MASEVKLPKLGENLEGGEVLDVKVAVGETVRVGQPLLEVEAEKSTVEIPSPHAGLIKQMMVQKGDNIRVGQLLCLLEESAVGAAPSAASVEPTPPPAAPRESPSIGATPVASKPTAQTAHAARVAGDGNGKTTAAEMPVAAGPATRRLARELGIDIRAVAGTASGGRVTPEDVKAFVRQMAAGELPRPAGGATPPLPDFERWGSVERVGLEPIRRRTADQMSLAWNTIPHVTQHDIADVTDLEAFRKQQEKKGPKLTITAFAIKAAASALRQYPHFNSSLDLAKGQLIVKKYCHIGVAVDTERGLLVPVLRDVDRKSIGELAQELIEIAERARQKKLSIDEMRGGTFTITNLGGVGGSGFTPIVNYPEVAILGLSRSRWQPAIVDGQVVPRFHLPLSLSYDHRVIDGADAARFTRRIADVLENPLQMLL